MGAAVGERTAVAVAAIVAVGAGILDIVGVACGVSDGRASANSTVGEWSGLGAIRPGSRSVTRRALETSSVTPERDHATSASGSFGTMLRWKSTASAPNASATITNAMSAGQNQRGPRGFATGPAPSARQRASTAAPRRSDGRSAASGFSCSRATTGTGSRPLRHQHSL